MLLQRQSPDRDKAWIVRVANRPAGFFAVFSLLYWIWAIRFATVKVLWYDELCGIFLADLGSFAQIWTRIQEGIELNPPLAFWVMAILRKSFGDSAAVSRIHAIAGFWVMLGCIFDLVRRRFGGVYAALSLVIPLVSFASYYSLEARPYGLLMGFAGIAVWGWISASDNSNRKVGISLLAISGWGLVYSHYYAPYTLAAIGCGELIRSRFWSKQGRCIDWAIWVSLACTIIPLVTLLPLLRTAHSGGDAFWSGVHFSQLLQTYSSIILAAGILLVPLLIGIQQREPEDSGPNLQLPLGWRLHEIICFGVLMAMPIVMFVVALSATHAFWARYMLPTVLGFSLAVPGGMAATLPLRRNLHQSILKIVLWGVAVPWTLFQLVSLTQPTAINRQLYVSHFAELERENLPMVIARDFLFLPAYHHGTDLLKKRLVYLTDIEAARKWQGFVTGEVTLSVLSQFKPIPLHEYEAWTRIHRRFALLRPHDSSWIIQKLTSDGAKFELRYSEYDEELADFQDWLIVTLPELKTTAQPSAGGRLSSKPVSTTAQPLPLPPASLAP